MKSVPTARTALAAVPAWMPVVLRLAAIYNLLYAVVLSLWPAQIFDWLGMPATPDAMIRCIGMMVGVYALGYWIAAQDMLRYWPLVVVGLVGKTLGPLGFLHGALTGVFAWKSGLFVLFSDLSWWVPFWAMTLFALKHRHAWDDARMRSQ
ncbi:hypothetical protein RA280_32800 [Cupriavidus sp. CV2]|uniref:hypothetical protein n=1 Tax=Cupriavidus ulmosensis TaxID=3065913 RepID=UPI00296B14EC|nr:hypothetical protein [Cupriavidus sp. CV2]MDW3686437.1 hypothetical protein [Cupriavidus sp. CV2]